MFKSTYYVPLLLLVTVAVSVAVSKWSYPTPSEGATSQQLDEVLLGIKKQSAAVAALEKNINNLTEEKADQQAALAASADQQAALAASVDELRTQLDNQKISSDAPVAQVAAAPAISDELLAKIDKQFTDVQQQLSSLQSIQNQLPLSNTQNTPPPAPNPYAGMSKEQIAEQEKVALQEEKQRLDAAVAATPDMGKTANITGRFESHWSKRNIVGPPPQINCSTILCHFKFDKPILETADGQRIDAMHALMESDSFPADGVGRTIRTRGNEQGGMDLYVGDAETFPTQDSETPN